MNETNNHKNWFHQNDDQQNQGFKLLKKVWKYLISAFKGNESISSLNFIGCFAYLIFLGIIDLNFLRKLHIQSSLKIFCGFGLAFFIWHLIAVRRCSPEEKKLTKEEKKQLQIQRDQERNKRFWRKLLLKEPIFDIKTSTFLTVIDLYFIVSCFQKLASNSI